MYKKLVLVSLLSLLQVNAAEFDDIFAFSARHELPQRTPIVVISLLQKWEQEEDMGRLASAKNNLNNWLTESVGRIETSGDNTPLSEEETEMMRAQGLSFIPAAVARDYGVSKRVQDHVQGMLAYYNSKASKIIMGEDVAPYNHQ